MNAEFNARTPRREGAEIRAEGSGARSVFDNFAPLLLCALALFVVFNLCFLMAKDKCVF